MGQGDSARYFDTSESMKNAGILCVFPIFHTARLGQKIRRSPQFPPGGVALIQHHSCRLSLPGPVKIGWACTDSKMRLCDTKVHLCVKPNCGLGSYIFINRNLLYKPSCQLFIVFGENFGLSVFWMSTFRS